MGLNRIVFVVLSVLLVFTLFNVGEARRHLNVALESPRNDEYYATPGESVAIYAHLPQPYFHMWSAMDRGQELDWHNNGLLIQEFVVQVENTPLTIEFQYGPSTRKTVRLFPPQPYNIGDRKSAEISHPAGEPLLIYIPISESQNCAWALSQTENLRVSMPSIKRVNIMDNNRSVAVNSISSTPTRSSNGISKLTVNCKRNGVVKDSRSLTIKAVQDKKQLEGELS